jgi:3'(2'), 5'-bisphosphate nucleotidase
MELLSAAVALARQAGELLVEMQGADDLDACSKHDGSPVTRADRAAHEMLVAGLADIASYLVFSEESGPREIARRRTCERVWIVDPLDGTRDYLRGSCEFAVNVALVEHGIPVLGVIDAPRLGVTYYAQRGGGAFRWRAGNAPERISCVQAAARARIVVSRSDLDVAWSTIASFAGVRVDGVSGAVKFGYVAEGSALAYPRLTPSSEWDIAAGHAVLAEAGARLVGVDGRDLTYNRADPLNPPFVATGSARIVAACASILALPLTHGAANAPDRRASREGQAGTGDP